MPFILCATICCCLPCLISVLGFRENFSPTRGATPEAINALPVYKFKPKSRNDLEFSEEDEGGFLLLGTEKKRLISGEDAVSRDTTQLCACLADSLNCVHNLDVIGFAELLHLLGQIWRRRGS